MPAVTRTGDSVITGHGCDGTTVMSSGSPDVFTNGIMTIRQGDQTVVHTIPSGDSCVPHTVPLISGSSTVFVNGKQCGRIGDPIDAGQLSGGSSNVFAGG